MSEPKKASEESSICRVCKKEIPSTAAKSAESRDYAYYFCGPGCEQRWQQERYNPDHVVRSE